VRPELVDGSFKGLPPLLPLTPVGAIGRLGWSLLDDSLPGAVAVLRVDALAHNRAWMRSFLANTGALLAPHAKTTMSPALFALQVQDGAWGLTVATVHQAKVAWDAGFHRLLLANELVTGPELEWVAAALRSDPAGEIVPLVDSLDGVARLAAAMATVGRPVPALVEVGYLGGRAGCRTHADALAVARAVAAAPSLTLRGIEAYEGLVAEPTAEAREARVAAFLDLVCAVAEGCAAEALFPPGVSPLLTAGGTSFPDLVARRFALLNPAFTPLLRSGCYLTGDHGIYAAALDRLHARDPALAALGGLVPALEVWATVLSRPEPGRVILAAGKRDIGIDAGLPVPLRWARPHEGLPAAIAGATVGALNDQHTHLVVPADSPLRVGDRVAFGITHPCTTFDRWSVLLGVDAGWRVVSAFRTYFG
jgi:D-serine dehydratase